MINRLPWLLDVAALVLGWTASNMILHDQRLGPILDQHSWTAFVIPGVILGVILAAHLLSSAPEARHPARDTRAARLAHTHTSPG